jgi:hypothetical protein
VLPVELQHAMRRIGDYDLDHTELIEQLLAQLDAALGRDCDLWDCCRNGEQCWKHAAAKPHQMHYRAPFVGPRYRERGICIVGMNSRDDGKLDSEYLAAAAVLELFRSGQRSYGGRFHYRAGTLASLFAASQDREQLDLAPQPEQIAEHLLSTARVQAVQCAPEGGRRTPTNDMWRLCPPLALERQIHVLQPRVIALLGTRTIAEVQDLQTLKISWTTTWRESGNRFARGIAHAGDSTAEIFGTYHPAYAGWGRSIAALKDSLSETPVDPPQRRD